MVLVACLAVAAFAEPAHYGGALGLGMGMGMGVYGAYPGYAGYGMGFQSLYHPYSFGAYGLMNPYYGSLYGSYMGGAFGAKGIYKANMFFDNYITPSLCYQNTQRYIYNFDIVSKLFKKCLWWTMLSDIRVLGCFSYIISILVNDIKNRNV